AVLGVLLALAGVHLVKLFGPPDVARLQEVSLDLWVSLFVFAVTLLSAVLFGLAPAFGVVRDSIAASLNEGGQRSAGSASASGIRNALFVSEVALALVLVIASALLVQTFVRLLQINPGFDPEHVLAFELSLPGSEYKDSRRIVGLYQRGLRILESIP